MSIHVGLVMVFFILREAYSLDIAEPFGRINCKESKIDKNVTLAEGRDAGRYLKANSSIANMKQCVSQCCRLKGCDVAFMVNKDCYSVLCRSIESCAPKQNDNKDMKTKVAYVAKLNKDHPKYLSSSSEGEPEVSEDLEAEYTEENPFSFEDDDMSDDDANSAETLKLKKRRSNRQIQDLVLAVGCGIVAVVVGVAGVIIMTRRLVEDEGRGVAYDWMSTKRESYGM